MPQPFVHLHNHSEFSLLDGASKIKDMVKYAVAEEMPAIALTDHGTMYGSFEFYKAAQAANIKGIVGVELYCATRHRTQRDPKKDGNYHLVALAKNEIGYKNLLQLVTKASLEGFYYKPRVDRELLEMHHEGLIICSACMGGELARAIRDGKGSLEGAKNVAAYYRELFGDDFYLEVQGHHAEGQWEINEQVARVSEQMGIKMVATNDSHYTKASDADAHDVLICIQTGTTVEDPKRMRYEPREFYLKTADEMTRDFEAVPWGRAALGNTLEVADKINLTIEEGRAPMPAVGLDEGKTAQETMERQCWEGLSRRIPNLSDVHRERLAYELDIVQKTGFAQYFLIVADISNHARSSGIYFGVRGSAAGSLASYCLGITDLDPIEYDLTFERFLNPERVTMPDIDMDFEDHRRSEVIEHVTKQYGKDNVSYITTFGTLGAKAALRDAGRALALPLPDVNRIAQMVPSLPLGITIDKAMHGWPEKDYSGNPEFVAEYQNNPVCQKLVDTAKRLEGMSRNASVHAAGVMIADRPLVEYTPLEKRGDLMVTQYPHSSLETIGLLKMDFLGLANLTILARSVKLIEQTRGEKIDVWNIPLHYDDPRAKAAYDMVGAGDTTGVFQLESQGMRKWVVGLKPNSVKELAAMVALYRPGPLAHIPRFIRSKFDPTQIKYTHPLLEPILKDTYGVIVYQDQVLKIVQAIAGFSLGQADLLRRAMGKKKASEMEKQKGYFLEGAQKKGVGKRDAEQIFAEIEPFAGYAFNGAHAACYAMVAYQTAYLKANYTAEYLAALMGAYIDNTEKIVNTLDECGRLSVQVLPPDVNESSSDFTVHAPTQSGYEGAIRFGLLAIKNVGKAPVEAILAARDKGGRFTSLEDFCMRVFAEGLTSKSVIEMLIKCGCLSSIHPNRRALMETLDDCSAAAARGAKDAAAGLISLFGEASESDVASVKAVAQMPDVQDFGRGERLQWEKELLGLYLSEHPLKPFEPELRRRTRSFRMDELANTQPNQEIAVGGLVTGVRTHFTKKGETMLFVTVEDATGSASATCFPRVTSEFGKFVIKDAVVVLRGKAQHRERMGRSQNEEGESGGAQVEILIDKVEMIAENAMAADSRVKTLHIEFDSNTRQLQKVIREMMRPNEDKSGSPLVIHSDWLRKHQAKSVAAFKVLADDELVSQIRQVLGNPRKVWVE